MSAIENRLRLLITDEPIKFVPRDIRTKEQIAAVIFIDVMNRFHCGKLTEEAALGELKRRLGPWVNGLR